MKGILGRKIGMTQVFTETGKLIPVTVVEVEKITILRAVHKYKDSREQFEKRTHKRLIDITNPTKETVEALTHLDIPSGVDIQIKL